VNAAVVLESSSNSAAALPLPPSRPVASRNGSAGWSPRVTEGGTASRPVAQRDGRGPMSNSSVPPRAMSRWRR
jgi:hypothetical protein